MDPAERLADLLEVSRMLAERRPEAAERTAEELGLDQEILAIVDSHFRRELLPKLLGRQLEAARCDVSLRYSEVLGQFFAKVLEHRPAHDRFWRAQTVSELVAWSCRVLQNLIRDHYRARAQRRQLSDGLARIAEERERAFEARFPDLRLEQVLEVLDRWIKLEGRPALRAEVLRRRYLGGQSRDEISSHLGIPTTLYDELRREAIERLRHG